MAEWQTRTAQVRVPREGRVGSTPTGRTQEVEGKGEERRVPRRFERHARTSEYWDSPPARSQERAAAAEADVLAEDHAPEPSEARRRKNTRDWCKGKEGRLHRPEITLKYPPCRWNVTYGADGYTLRWSCGHAEVCGRCGKILTMPWQLPKDRCPTYPGTDAEQAEAVRRAAEAAASRRRWYHRRPAITGPQGYRKKKETT